MHIIKPDGTIEERLTDNPEGFELEELQELVGGYLEMVRLDRPVQFKSKRVLTDEDSANMRPGSDLSPEYTILVVNEDGKLKGLEHNKLATTLWQNAMETVLDDYLVGTVLFVTEEEFQ